ncbi:hypothetical protein N7476_004936 [Penicillium atrosanguineum]|uniref:PRISE-like Rossmann-fold domain-containing protein n=1 Tax=Penicillium atrosanguineum TaxID=1132637 RepID=A0A9W9PYH9_9EURO|nr:hypothetical protein N7476_004936 [Penicillium atrosanguineum]
MAKTAFITGANGISGSAIVEHLCNTTAPDDWGSIIVTSRSPFNSTVTDPRVKFIALDFTHSIACLVEKMKDVCRSVSHAYFCSYLHKDDFAESCTINKIMFENFLNAIDKTALELENVTLQTGGKYYNLHVEPVPTPARENDPRRYGPFENFYFHQEDKLADLQRGKAWSWNVIRPEAIIGANSQPYGLNEALTIAMYFLICRELGTAAPMPTNQRYWEGTEDVSHAPLIADLAIFVSTRKLCANEAFNINNGDYFSWRYMWPRLAENLGAAASSQQRFEKALPKEGDLQLELSLAEWCQGKRKVWEDLCERQGLPGAKTTFDLAGWAVGDFLFQRTWSATLSVNKARRFGWTGHADSYQSFVDTFEKFRQLGLIPK